MNNRIELTQLFLGTQLPNWDIKPIFEQETPKISDFNGKPLLILIFGSKPNKALLRFTYKINELIKAN